jgi:hypothetical protein
MSYKYSVLFDNPIAFYRSNNISHIAPQDYQELLDGFTDYQDFENSFLSYSSVLSNSITDASSCNNDAAYFGTFTEDRLPLVAGENYAVRIDHDNYITIETPNGYNGIPSGGGFGTSYTSDNDFSLELWVYPQISDHQLIQLIGDRHNGVGLFYENGNIVFKLNSERVDYTIPYLNKAIHVVAAYSKSNAAIYIDGVLQSSKQLIDFNFTNNDLALYCGPTYNPTDYFLTNAIAVYRYALSNERITNHYDSGQALPGFQITLPDNGELFEFFDNKISTKYSYSLPANKTWEDFITDDLIYNSSEKSIAIKYGTGVAKSVELNHFITIPSGPSIDDSRIEWDGDNGITVEASVDGTNYLPCVNGQSIPQYSFNAIDSSLDLYIKITLSTSNNIKYLPKLYNLSISFYDNQVMYAQNSASYFSKIESVSGNNVNLSNKRYPILSRDRRNGLRAESHSGFYINAVSDINTLEFIYTPDAILPILGAESTNIDPSVGDILDAEVNTISAETTLTSASINSQSNNLSCLILQDSNGLEYSWDNDGLITYSGIDSIYVNGVQKIAETNISGVFTPGEPHHVVIVFSEAITGQITFNYIQYGAVPALYQNIALYSSAFNQSKIIEHFNLYIGKDPEVIVNTLLELTENSVNTYNNDWLVIQNS